MDYSVYDLAEVAIKPNYDLQLINLSEQAFINPAFKTLLILKPTIPFTDEQKLKIDQFVMRGGSVVFCVDRLNAEMDSLRIKNEVVAYDRELNIYDLLFRYGVRINPNLLMDLQCDYIPFDVNGNGQFEFLPWNYFPVLESPENHPINKNLGYVAGKFVNGIDTIETPGIEKTILLNSSPNARLISSPAIISGSQNVTAAEDQKYRTAHIPVAVLLEGKFKSFYANRLTTAMNDSLQKAKMQFLPACTKDNKIVVVSDGDVFLNSVSKGNEPLAMGMNMYTFGTQRAFPFANKDFLLNTLNYLINENDLSEAKNKDYTLKLLDTKKVNAEKIKWQFVNIALPILLVLLFAMLFQWLRKRKYARK
jgi:gliding-associated putative ABC transporter substrate-binding component GldG